MGETAIAPPPPDDQPAGSVFSRLIGIFISPGEAFEDIARKPGFLAPIILIIIAACGLFDTMYVKLGMETMTRLTLERSPFTSHLQPEQMEKAIQDSASHLTRQLVITDISIVIVTFLFLLILAAVGLLIVNVILGGQAKFKTLFSVASYAQLPALLGYALGFVVILFGGTDNLDPQNPIPLNLAFFLNYKEVAKPLFALAGSVDIVIIWMIILLGLGMSKATGGKVKTMPITLCFVGAWAIWIIGKVALSAVF